MDWATSNYLHDTLGTSGFCTGGDHILLHENELIPTQIDGGTLMCDSLCGTKGGIECEKQQISPVTNIELQPPRGGIHENYSELKAAVCGEN